MDVASVKIPDLHPLPPSPRREVVSCTRGLPETLGVTRGQDVPAYTDSSVEERKVRET